MAYLSGFDPQGAPHYHQLFKEQAARQAAVNGWPIDVGPRRKASDTIAHWSVTGHEGPEPTDTRYEFLRWDDIVRAHWPRSRWGLYRATAWGSWQMWRNGVMRYTLARSWPMGVAIALPGLLMAGCVLLACLLIVAAGMLGSAGHAWGALALLLVGAPVLAAGGLQAERRSHMAWLMRSLACLVRQGRGQTPSLEERLQAHADHLSQALQGGEYDEVVVIGHSSGAMMAAIVMATALRQSPRIPEGLSIGLLTLGHCSPLLSQQPEAHAYREALVDLCRDPRVHWADVTAPPDGCCFALMDPTEGLEISADDRRPQVINPKFAQAFAPEQYQAVRQDKFRCHFQYLMAGERPVAWDLFSAVAGRQRFATRLAPLGSVRGFAQFRLRVFEKP